MRLNKTIREDFVEAVMAAVPKTPEPDYSALIEAVVAEAEQGLPLLARDFAKKFPRLFRRDHTAYLGVKLPDTEDYGRVRTQLVARAACIIDKESVSWLRLAQAADDWTAAEGVRQGLERRLRATVAECMTTEAVEQALPELASVLNSVVKRPLVPAGSLDLVAQLRAAGLKLKE